jgi:hypothetical protein
MFVAVNNTRFKMNTQTSLRTGQIHDRVPALPAKSSAFVAAGREWIQVIPFLDAGTAVQLAAPLTHRSNDQRKRILVWGTAAHH